MLVRCTQVPAKRTQVPQKVQVRITWEGTLKGTLALRCMFLGVQWCESLRQNWW